MSESISVVINGEPRELSTPATLVDALVLLGFAADQKGVAVAVEGSVVRRAEWAETPLAGGERIEVVSAAQGG